MVEFGLRSSIFSVPGSAPAGPAGVPEAATWADAVALGLADGEKVIIAGDVFQQKTEGIYDGLVPEDLYAASGIAAGTPYWFDAEDISGGDLSGSDLIVLPNRGTAGNLTPEAAGKEPLYDATEGPDGKPAFHLQKASNDEMIATGTLDQFNGIGNAFCVAVVKAEVATGFTYNLFHVSQGDDATHARFTGRIAHSSYSYRLALESSRLDAASTGTLTAPSGDGLTPGTWAVVAWWMGWEAGLGGIYIPGAHQGWAKFGTISTVGVTDVTDSLKICVGGNTGSNTWDGWVREMIFRTDLDIDSCVRHMRWLQHKYNIL